MIHTRFDRKRGCGFRKPGGLYLISGGRGRPCGKLPHELTVCPTCHAGIHFSRGWTWVDADRLFAEVSCKAPVNECASCPLSNQLFGKAGLLWIGEQFYKTPDHYIDECNRLGISRRISAVPQKFELGKTWVLLAHKKCLKHPTLPDEWLPGIFRMFKPDAVEYVTKGDETDEEIEALEKRGITPVKVETGTGASNDEQVDEDV